MSGPVTTEDTAPEGERTTPEPATVEITVSRSARVGGFEVRRALPRRGRRTVGAWCFLDHMGPAQVTVADGVDVAPHPHLGLQTVTWLLAGEVIHHDSLGSEQLIRPGELNLMTAGHGVAHSEERTGRYAGAMQGAQLWLAQPAATRNGGAAFEHHRDLPQVDLDGSGSSATVLVGPFQTASSPARVDTDHVGVDLDLRAPSTVVPLRPDSEYALVVLTGAVSVDGQVIEPGHLGYLGLGRDECRLSTKERTRALLIGGVPFEESILMWWNFVARTQDEITAGYREWAERGERFGTVASALPPVEVAPPWWASRRI
jgi:redox-sensitive bicupin YhaK (pirin superfamily)